jgi:hypothetical protein
MKIYSNQNISGPEVIQFVSEVQTLDQDWWMIFNAENNEIIVEPLQCRGFTSSPYTMVVADTKDELDQYIIDNNLSLASE